MIPLTLYWTWAAWVIWNWYAPVIGIEPASFAKVFGITLVFSCIRGYQSTSKADSDDPKSAFISICIGPLVLIAWARFMLWLLVK